MPALPSKPDLLEQALRLSRAGEPFVLATVIRADKPTSAKPGAKALITDDGRRMKWIGWVGGSCSMPAVEREVRKALATGEPAVLRLSSAETCASGGTLEIYIEPHLPKPHLVVVGHLPVAEALVALAKPLGFRVTVSTPEGNRDAFPDADEFRDRVELGGVEGETYVVVASHGNYDEEGIRSALTGTKSEYVALVSSRKRAESLLDRLSLGDAARSRLKFPAGLDIGATTPEEIALSILAEIVQVRRRKKNVMVEEPVLAKDPICGMMVDVATARHVLEKDGTKYYFCCDGCKERFAHAS